MKKKKFQKAAKTNRMMKIKKKESNQQLIEWRHV